MQADGEPSTKQLLKSVQEARRRLGLSTEIRLSGTDQHQSNGAAERAIQTIRRLANTYRKSLEQKIEAQVPSTCHIFPWATQHAAFIYNRFHVHRGSRRTSYEILTDTTYKGKICEFGESVLAKAPAAAVYKGSNHWTKGIRVGKSLTSDCHVILTKAGVMMARSVRRLPQPFDKDLIFAVRGLSWNHKPDGEALRLKRLGGRMHRQPQGVEDVVSEAEMQRMAVQVGAAAAASLMKSEGEPVTDEAGDSIKPAAVAAAAPAFSGKRKSSQAMLPLQMKQTQVSPSIGAQGMWRSCGTWSSQFVQFMRIMILMLFQIGTNPQFLIWMRRSRRSTPRLNGHWIHPHCQRRKWICSICSQSEQTREDKCFETDRF